MQSISTDEKQNKIILIPRKFRLIKALRFLKCKQYIIYSSRDGLKSELITGIIIAALEERSEVSNCVKILTIVKSCHVNPPTISALIFKRRYLKLTLVNWVIDFLKSGRSTNYEIVILLSPFTLKSKQMRQQQQHAHTTPLHRQQQQHAHTTPLK